MLLYTTAHSYEELKAIPLLLSFCACQSTQAGLTRPSSHKYALQKFRTNLSSEHKYEFRISSFPSSPRTSWMVLHLRRPIVIKWRRYPADIALLSPKKSKIKQTLTFMSLKKLKSSISSSGTRSSGSRAMNDVTKSQMSMFPIRY